MAKILKTLPFTVCALLLGVFAIFVSLIEDGYDIEKKWGLTSLFGLRGEIAAPKEVVIVSVDPKSLNATGLPIDKQTPNIINRMAHKALIAQLNSQQPQIIAFSYFFRIDKDPKIDSDLADAIAHSGNIILSSLLENADTIDMGSGNTLHMERIKPPIEAFANAALAVAPFAVDNSDGISQQFWTYKESAGDMATLPTTIFHWYVLKTAYTEITHLLSSNNSAFKPLLPSSFEQFKANRQAIEQLRNVLLTGGQSFEDWQQLLASSHFSDEKKQLIAAWLAYLMHNDDLVYFNHYGSNGSITTLPLSTALTLTGLKQNMFANKIVLVGQSEAFDTGQINGYKNTFSKLGENISAVELAATAVANLLTNTWIKPLAVGDQCLLLLSWVVFLTLLCWLLAYPLAVIALLLCSLGYWAISCYLFTNQSIWIPTIIPTLLQAPLLLFGISFNRFWQTQKEKQNIEQAIQYYLPEHVVNQISNNNAAQDMQAFGELINGICLATDAGQYTRLSESLPPDQLNVLMNSYYGVIFPEVTHQDGIISDIVGDAMMALWRSAPNSHNKASACHAALAIKQAVDNFNANNIHQIPTRLGLHYGEMRLGNVGAVEHYEYRAVGDTVNTASRIEGLNKQLGTQILMSSQVIEGVAGFVSRELGIFYLPGKTLPINIYELMGNTEESLAQQLPLIIGFSKALGYFQQHHWPQALQLFLLLQKQFPNDGPTQFYINLIRNESLANAVIQTSLPVAVAVKKS
ncbi:hypothetical protein JCM14076_15010 [Methylosoma difficile]